ncbi:MAG: hypothetical protein AAF709_26250 [Pseudomonadota bacterium]
MFEQGFCHRDFLEKGHVNHDLLVVAKAVRITNEQRKENTDHAKKILQKLALVIGEHIERLKSDPLTQQLAQGSKCKICKYACTNGGYQEHAGRPDQSPSRQYLCVHYLLLLGIPTAAAAAAAKRRPSVNGLERKRVLSFETLLPKAPWI